jgi:hypothetical protein
VDPYLFSAARKGHVFGAPSPTTPSPLCDRNGNFVLVWPAGGGAGALRTLENARRSARSTRDIRATPLSS